MKSKENKVVIEVENKPSKSNTRVIALLSVAVAVLLVVIVGVVYLNHKRQSHMNIVDVTTEVVENVESFVEEEIIGEEGEVNTITESTIKEVFEISELQTADYIYNAVVHVPTDDGSEYKYHVAYEGTVTAGINFSDLQISVNDETKVISITIPEVTVIDTVVTAGTLQYIFTKDKYDNETVYAEAYRLCQQDLDEKAETEQGLINLAKENAKQIVEALVQPWVEQIDSEYTIEIN